MVNTLTSREAIGYRAWLARRAGEPTSRSAWGEWRAADDLLVPVEVSNAVAPDYLRAKAEINLPAQAIDCWRWRELFAVEDRLLIVSDHPNRADRVVLFDGVILEIDWHYTHTERAMVTAAGWAFRLHRDVVVYGRWMHPLTGPLFCATGLPCEFNAGGRPNRAKNPGEDTLPVFTWDGDPAACWWTAPDIYRYLLGRYNAQQTWIANPADAEYPESASSEPVVVAVDGLSLWQALAAVADRAGHDVCEAVADADGALSPHVEIIPRHRGPELVLDHQPVNADGSEPALDSRATNLYAASVAETAASCVAAPIVAGGRELVEITVPLGQAWDPQKLEIPAGEQAVPDADKDGVYYARYCTAGSQFASYAACGRLWDANSDARYSGPPWSLSTPDVASLAGDEAGTWPAGPYRPLPMLTRLVTGLIGAVGQTADAFCEVSYDSGSTWRPILRARLTCCVESPYRAIVQPDRLPAAGTCFPATGWYDRAAAGGARRRAADSRFAGSSGSENLPADETDPADPSLRLAAERIRAVCQDRYVEANLPIEWVEPCIRLGDQVTAIRGINVPLAVNAGSAVRGPRVVGYRHMLTPETYQTQLTLDTDRKTGVS